MERGNLDIFKISDSEFPKLVKEYSQQDLDKLNRNYYFRSRNSHVVMHHNYIRGFKISEADNEEDENLELSWNLWDYYFEIIEHELIGS